jgi:hypothetical protein
VVLAIGHTVRTHKALGCPDALSGFLQVIHRLVKDGVFVSHEKSIRVGGILRSPDHCVVSRELPYQRREVAGCVPANILLLLGSHLRQPSPLPGNH